MALNILGPIALVMWYVNVNHIPLVREDINEPAVMTQVIIATSIGGALLLGFILLCIFVSYDKNNPKCCRFGHLHRSDDVIRQGRPQRIYCPRCGKDFGEYRILSTMNRETCEVTDYDKDGNRIFDK
jgi:hypothetical protein